jgi:hypothetical protein
VATALASWSVAALALLVLPSAVDSVSSPVDILGHPPISSLGSTEPAFPAQRCATTTVLYPPRLHAALCTLHSHSLQQASFLAPSHPGTQSCRTYLHYLQESNVTDPAACSRAASLLLCPFSPCLDRQSSSRESLRECCLSPDPAHRALSEELLIVIAKPVHERALRGNLSNPPRALRQSLH